MDLKMKMGIDIRGLVIGKKGTDIDLFNVPNSL